MERNRIWIPAIAGLCGAWVVALRRRGKSRPSRPWPANLAHRGASARAPENTIEAFRLAVEKGAGGLELDVHATRDGEIVVIHDATVDRTTDGSGAVTGMTMRELRGLDAGYRFSSDGGLTFPYRDRGITIPTLAEVYEEFPDVPVNADIKEARGGMEEAVLRVIERAGAEARTLVASNDHAVVRRFRSVSGAGFPRRRRDAR